MFVSPLQKKPEYAYRQPPMMGMLASVSVRSNASRRKIILTNTN